jgi:SAM-dependent methyltransferase
MLGIKKNNIDLIAKYLGSQKKVLDFGCGSGLLMNKLLQVGHDAFGCDVANLESLQIDNLGSKELVSHRIKMSSQTAIPFKDNTFDSIVSNQVFEHVSDVKIMISEIARVLKSNGEFIILFPTKEIIIEPHLKLAFIHRIIQYPMLVKIYLDIAYILKLGSSKKSTLSRKMWVKDRFEYLNNDVNYTFFAEFKRLLQEYQFSCRDYSLHHFMEKFNRKWLIKLFDSIFGIKCLGGVCLTGKLIDSKNIPN